MNNCLAIHGILKREIKKKAFRERRHLHACDLLTLTLGQGRKGLCRLLYCTLVPGMMSVSVIVCEIWPLVKNENTFYLKHKGRHFRLFFYFCSIKIRLLKYVISSKQTFQTHSFGPR